MVSAKSRPRPSAPRELLCHHGVWIDFSRCHGFRRESGERFPSILRFPLLPDTGQKTGHFPK